MIPDQEYYKDAVARVLELMENTFGDIFKAYFDGLLEDIPQEYLPCIMATSTDGQIEAGATGTDDIGEKLTIVVAVNERDFLGADNTTNMADVAVRHLVMGQDPTTKQYVEQSVMYVLRKHFTLEDGAVGNKITFNFYPATRGSDVFTREAELSLILSRMAMVPQRD